MTLSRIRSPLTELEIDATIENSILEINSLSAYSNKDTDFWDDAMGVVNSLFRAFRGETRREGALYGEGKINLEDLTHPQIDLSLNTYKLYLDYFGLFFLFFKIMMMDKRINKNPAKRLERKEKLK